LTADPSRSLAPARVIRVAGPSATVADAADLREVRLPPGLAQGPPAAGDLVELTPDGGGVERILPRTSELRRGSSRGPRVIAANADLVIAVESVVDPPIRPRFLDRYLAAAEIGGMDAAIVLTKIDLPHDAESVAAIAWRYEQIGYTVLRGVAFAPEFAERVRRLIDGRLAVLAGHSGVGKSTLTTALTGVERATGAVSRKARAGRHTTTDPRLVEMPGGGAVIDTAGVRTFHLAATDPEALGRGFREIAALAPECRFRGCRHIGEDGCAAPGRVSPERLDSYRRLLAGS
jgi:ribosome biogenesis GTPase